MVHVFGVRIKVADYAKWKASFDSSAPIRKAAGEMSYRLFRSVDDPNELLLMGEWDTAENARAFIHSEELRKAQEEAGVVGLPDSMVVEEIDQGRL